MNKIFWSRVAIFVAMLACFFLVNKLNLLNFSNAINPDTKEALLEIADLTKDQFVDMEGDNYPYDKHDKREQWLNETTSTDKSDYGIIVDVLKKFKTKDSQNFREYDEATKLINMSEVFSDSTLLSSKRIDRYISDLDELIFFHDIYLNKYNNLMVKVHKELSSTLKESSYGNAKEDIQRTSDMFLKSHSSTKSYYLALKKTLILMKEINSKDQFVVEDGRVLIKDDYYVKLYNKSINEHNDSLMNSDKDRKNYLTYMQKVADDLKKSVQKLD